LPRDFDLVMGKPEELAFPVGDHRGQWYKAAVEVGAGHWECTECSARCEGRVCSTHGKRKVKGGTRYRGITLRHCRHTSARNMSDAGVDRKRGKEVLGDVTDSMYDRYNIPKDKDLAETREKIERFHRQAQRRRRSN
jgi:hypothetical protein